MNKPRRLNTGLKECRPAWGDRQPDGHGQRLHHTIARELERGRSSRLHALRLRRQADGVRAYCRPSLHNVP